MLVTQNELDSSEKEYLFKYLSSKNNKSTKGLFQIIQGNTTLRNKLDYLLLLKNNLQKITIAQYICSTPTFVVFVNSTQNENQLKIAKMIFTVCAKNDIYVIHSDKNNV